MASLLLAAPEAHAGTWQFTCTGSGSETEDTQTPTLHDTHTQNWVPPGSSTGSYFQLSGFSVATQPGQFSTTQAGTTKSGGGSISAAVMLTWVPDAGQTATSDPPPTSVLLGESSSASWTAQVDHYPDPYTTGGTSADNGLGDAEVATYYGGVKNGGTSSGSHYSAKSPSGGTLTLNRSFSAQATASSGPSTAGVNFGFSFGSYALAVASPTIKITGTYDPAHGDFHVLTGQQITATLQGLSGYKVTKYTWAVGGSTFKDYDFTLPSNQLVPLGPSDLAGPASGTTSIAALNFYDRVTEDLTVTCTATVLAPDGTSLSITATSPQINVVKPSVAHWGYSEGYVQPRTNSNGQTYGLYPDPATSNPQGMTWHDVTVTVPAPFSGGRCDFAQLAKPDREEYRGNTSNPLNNDPKNGLIGLDGNFPYSYGGYGSGWNPPATGGNSDSPQLIANGNPNNDTQLSANDTFTTWVIYRPPSQNGNSTVWVPLQKYSWTWSAQLTWSSSQWNITAAFPNAAGAGPTYTPQDTNDPPQWTLVH